MKKSGLQESSKEDAEFVRERDGFDKVPAEDVLLKDLVKALPTMELDAKLGWVVLMFVIVRD